MKLFKTALLFISFVSTSIISAPSFAADEVYTGLFSSNAIKGYDTVAYFTQGKPVKGSDEFSSNYKGVNWLFSSQQNLDLFLAEPTKYEPQYGGYCAYAVSQGSTASIKPELFTIYQDKLYLNYSSGINDKWLANKDDFIEKADANWPAIIAK